MFVWQLFLVTWKHNKVDTFSNHRKGLVLLFVQLKERDFWISYQVMYVWRIMPTTMNSSCFYFYWKNDMLLWGALIACSCAIIVVLEFREECSLCRAEEFNAHNHNIRSQNHSLIWIGRHPQRSLSPPLNHSQNPKNHIMCLTALSKHLNSDRLGPVTISSRKKMEESENLSPVDKYPVPLTLISSVSCPVLFR